ncbi:MAG: ComF family protein [Nitrospinota bacterium]|nr:MAG: ComF family protein [Nitrospinota bacterium]
MLTFRRLGEGILDTIFPRHCLLCTARIRERGDTLICEQCWKKIPLIHAPYCPRCGLPFASPAALCASPEHQCASCRHHPPPFEVARAVGRYEGVLRELIHLFKYQRRLRLGKALVALMDQHWGERFPDRQFDYLVPVPLHHRRLREREFNQAQVLAEGLGRLRDIPVLTTLLAKRCWTRSQVELSGQERRENVRDTFILQRAERIHDKSLLLIDDVFTTGATASEAARVLTAGGAARVAVYTVARVVERSHGFRHQ